MKLTLIALLSITILLGAAAFQMTDSTANGAWATRVYPTYDGTPKNAPTQTQRPLPSLYVTVVPPLETATPTPTPRTIPTGCPILLCGLGW